METNRTIHKQPVSSYYVIIIFILSLLIGYRPIEFGTDWSSYKEIYDNSLPTDILLYITGLLFSSYVNFELFFSVITFIAMYSYVYSLTALGTTGGTRFFSFLVFFSLHISGQWRTGIALALILYFIRKKYPLMLSALIAGFMHSVGFIISLFALFKVNKLFILSSFLFFFILFTYLVPLIDPNLFESIGRRRFFLAMIDPLHPDVDAKLAYLHRSIWSLNNIRLYYILIILSILFTIKEKNSLIKLLIAGNSGYLILGFDASFAQKCMSFVTPITILAAKSIENKNLRLIFYTLTISTGILEVFRRFFAEKGINWENIEKLIY